MGCALLTGAFEIGDPSYSHIARWKELSRRPLKFSEWLPWLFYAAFFVEADYGSACSASMVARTCAIPAKPFTRLNCCSQ